MAVIGANSRPGSVPKWAHPWALYTGIVIVTACILWAISVTVASANLRESFEDQMALADAQSQRQATMLQKDGLRQSAESVAASVKPLLIFKGQVPEITDRTLQAVVSDLVDTGRYCFVAISDSDGKVLASSDLALIGKSKATPPANSVETNIGDAPRLGTLILAPSK